MALGIWLSRKEEKILPTRQVLLEVKRDVLCGTSLAFLGNVVLEQFWDVSPDIASGSHQSGCFIAAKVLGYGGIDTFDKRNWLLVGRRRRQAFAQQLEKFGDAMQAL